MSIVQKRYGAVARLLYKLAVDRVGILAFPVVCVHRPEEARRVRSLEHTLIIVTVGRTEHIAEVLPDGAVEYRVGFLKLLADLRVGL